MQRTYSFDEEAAPNDPSQPMFIYSRSISAAVYLAHRLGVVALILVVIWAMFHESGEKYLGGLSWEYPHVFNWHPVMMVAGMVISLTEALLAFRAFPFDKVINRRVRYMWHTAGIAMMIVGLVAVFQYENHHNKANLWSMHSWFGIITIVLFLAQYLLGGYLFFNEAADPDMREVYIPYFAWLDILVYVFACFSAESGIVEKNTDLGCSYNITNFHHYDASDPAKYYSDIPTGCRVSNGLGIVILMLCLCTLYAALELKLPDVTSTSAGWEAYRLTDEEINRRGGMFRLVCSWCFPSAGKKKRRGSRPSVQSDTKRRGKSIRKKTNWVEKNDGDGVYYYNTKTKQTTKDKPLDFV